jgi:hypothetical protein
VASEVWCVTEPKRKDKLEKNERKHSPLLFLCSDTSFLNYKLNLRPMDNKIDLKTFRARFPQEWPRYTIGMIATVGLKRAIHTGSYLFTMKPLFPPGNE